jgi:hypothetical protein
MIDELIYEVRRYVMLFFKEGYYKYVLAIIAYFVLRHANEVSVQKSYDFIKKDMSFGKAKYIGMSPRNPKSGEWYRWEVYVDTFVFKKSILYTSGDYPLKPGIWAPVVYMKGNPYHYEILWTPDLFSEFGVPIPDSLKWTKNFKRNPSF